MSPDRQLEDLLAVLVQRFGRSRTLGEVYATVHALSVLRSGGDLTLSEVAGATGASKQNLSRWLKHQIDTGHVTTREAEDDARMRKIDLTDPCWAYRHLEPVAEVLGCEVHPPLLPSDD